MNNTHNPLNPWSLTADPETRTRPAPSLGTIGLVTPYFAPHIGGVEKHVEELARGLLRRGLSVEIITTDASGKLPPSETRDGLLIHRFPVLMNNDIFVTSPQLSRWLNAHAGRYSLLHAHSYHTPLALQAALACRAHGIPFVVTPHYHGTGHTSFRKLLHVPYRSLGRWMLRQAKAVLCVSEVERELIERHFPHNLPTRIIPNGVALRDFDDVPPLEKHEHTTIILAVGRLEAYKRVDKLVEAIPYLPHNYQVIIVGDGPQRTALEAQISELALDHRALTTGHLPRESLLRWFRSADVFVSMSTHEAFGMTLLESAGAGAAVVASDIPAHREVTKYLPPDHVALVDPNSSPAELARAIVRRAEAHHQQARPVSTDKIPTWDHLTDQVMRTYLQVVSH